MEASLKKRTAPLIILAAVVIFCAVFIGNRYYTTHINLDKFCQALLSGSVYSGMKELDQAQLPGRYPGVALEDVKEARVYADGGATAREFAIIETAGTASTDRVNAGFSRYCQMLLDQYQQTNPEEYDRVKGFRIFRTRNYVILLISDQMSSGVLLMEDYFNKTRYDRSE